MEKQTIGYYNGSWVTQFFNITPSNSTSDNFLVDVSVLSCVGVVVLMTICLSFFHMYKHFVNYTRPNQQRHIVRIILIVPLYSLCSYLSLFFYNQQTYFAIFRDCYEAYALYQFFALCIELANGWKNMEAAFVLRNERPWPLPCCCFNLKPTGKTLMWCQRGILQYVLIRPVTTIASAVLLATELYNEGEWKINRGWFWIMIVNNVCVSFSLYFIVLFYQLSKQALKPYHPLLKFSVIKGIVFFCYWQSIIFAAIVWIPFVRFRDWNREHIAYTLQNLLICFEMFGFAVLQWFAFPYAFYEINALSQAPLARAFEAGGKAKGIGDSMVHALNQDDMTKATVDSFVPKKLREYNNKKKEKRRRDSTGDSGIGIDISLSESETESTSEEDGGHQDIIRKALQDPNRVILNIQDDRSEERKEERIRSGLNSPRGEKKNKNKIDDEMIELDDYDALSLDDDIIGKTDGKR